MIAGLIGKEVYTLFEYCTLYIFKSIKITSKNIVVLGVESAFTVSY